MRKKPNLDIYKDFLILSAGLLFGLLFSLVAQHLSLRGEIIFIVCNVFIISILSYFISNTIRNNMKRFLLDITRGVNGVLSGTQTEMDIAHTPASIGYYYLEKETKELLQSLETLKSTMFSQGKTKDSVLAIINNIALNIEMDELLADMLPKIIDGTKSNWGAVYIRNIHTEKMELKSSIGFSKNIYNEFDIAIGEGFIGKSALNDQISVSNDIPADTVYSTRTFLGKIKPRAVMTIPIMDRGENIATLLLASIYNYEDEHIDIVKMIRYYLGSAITSAMTYERTTRLKNELQFQNQLIQDMNEDLEEKIESRSLFLQRTMDSIVDYAVISMDAYGNVIMWNRGAEIIRGYLAEEVIGKHISFIYNEEEKVGEKMRREIAMSEGRYEEYVNAHRKDGTPIYVHKILTRVNDENGEIVGFTNVTREVK